MGAYYKTNVYILKKTTPYQLTPKPSGHLATMFLERAQNVFHFCNEELLNYWKLFRSSLCSLHKPFGNYIGLIGSSWWASENGIISLYTNRNRNASSNAK
jgi:hypothetical protein